MGSAVFLLIAVIVAAGIFRSRNEKKLFWAIGSVLFFPQSIQLVGSPTITFPQFVVFILFLDFLYRHKRFAKDFKSFPLKKPTIFIFICLLIIGLVDQRLNFIQHFYRPLTFFLESFFVLFCSYSLVTSKEGLIKTYEFFLRCLLICCIYGLIVKILGTNIYTNYISEACNTIDYGNIYAAVGDKRVRISSFTWHPIYYGLILALGITAYLLLYYTASFRKVNKIYFFVIFLFICLNLFWTNSRTPLLSLVGGISIFFVFGIGFKRRFRLFLLGVAFASAAITLFPNAFQIVGDSIDTFSAKGSDLEGSSLEMRQAQMVSSFIVFAQSPIFGNGFDYITEGLGYSIDLTQRKSDQSLQGFESYAYKMLIEQGLIGIIGNFWFFYCLFRFFTKRRKKVDFFGKKLVYISISLLITFLLFIFGTGDMNSFTFFMLLLGGNVKVVSLISNEGQSRNILQNGPSAEERLAIA